jgi:predicted dehydrogenase
MRRIGWGIIGTGWMAQRSAKTLNALPDARLAAVCSRDAGRAAAFRTAHGVATAYADPTDFLADPAVEVVYIATPHPTHYPLAMLALEAGKAVVVEKPFALNREEAWAIAERARAENLFCMEAMWTRFLPLYAGLKNVMAEAGLGTPLALRAEFGRPVAFDPAGRFFDRAQGGGSLLDMGVYCVSVATQLLGRPEEIHSIASIGRTGVDEQCAIVLRYRQGIATLASSLRSSLSNDVTLFCAEGGLRIEPPFIGAEVLQLWHLSSNESPLLAGDASRVLPTSDVTPSGVLGRLLRRDSPVPEDPPGTARYRFPALPHRHAHQALEVMRCLREGLSESPVLPLSESLLVMDILDRIREAWAE